ncbi:MAG: site-2 protease family protein [Clostridia bacterium]|nr:site-2 protease family protein [Clostridia bacterium]
MASLGLAFGKVWPILAALLFFGLIIMTHEGGHFAAAKLFKVKVNEFAVGMGPVLWKKQGKETQYSVRLLPIGGYCAMEGEDEDSEHDRAFNNKPPWQRAIIILAGATVNILTGIIIMAIILGTSDLIGTPGISGFYGDKASQEQGLEVGDRIVAVNNHVVRTSYDLSYFMMRDPDGVIDFVVDRDGKKEAIRSVKFQTEEVEGTSTVVYDFSILGVKPTPGNVLKYAFLNSFSIVRIVWDSLIDLVTLNYDLKQLSGPIGTVGAIAETASDAVKTTNYSSLLLILAFIAINVGAFNLIPFPALDGGRFLFILFEGITGKRVSRKVEAAINSAGMALLLGLMVIVTVSDVMKFL